jgi:hypothetical protein
MRAVVHDESLPFASCVVPHVVNLPAEGSDGSFWNFGIITAHTCAPCWKDEMKCNHLVYDNPVICVKCGENVRNHSIGRPLG